MSPWNGKGRCRDVIILIGGGVSSLLVSQRRLVSKGLLLDGREILPRRGFVTSAFHNLLAHLSEYVRDAPSGCAFSQKGSEILVFLILLLFLLHLCCCQQLGLDLDLPLFFPLSLLDPFLFRFFKGFGRAVYGLLEHRSMASAVPIALAAFNGHCAPLLLGGPMASGVASSHRDHALLFILLIPTLVGCLFHVIQGHNISAMTLLVSGGLIELGGKIEEVADRSIQHRGLALSVWGSDP